MLAVLLMHNRILLKFSAAVKITSDLPSPGSVGGSSACDGGISPKQKRRCRPVIFGVSKVFATFHHRRCDKIAIIAKYYL